MARSIPLGKFPYVILVEILKSMQTMEILALCQASKNTKNVVRSIIKTNNYGMKIVRQRRCYCISFGNLETKDESKFNIIQYKQMEIEDKGVSIIEIWIDQDQGLMDKMDLLKDVLDIKNALFDFEADTPQDESTLLKILEHAKNNGFAFRSIRLSGLYYIPTVFEYFLEHSDEHSEMTLQSYSPHVYQFKRNSKLRSITIEKSEMNNIPVEFFLSCEEVKLEECCFSAGATREFLRRWQQKANTKMRRFEFKQSDMVFGMDLEWVLQGLDAQMVRQKVMDDGGLLLFQPKQAYRIQRKDGVGFTVSYVNRAFSMISD